MAGSRSRQRSHSRPSGWVSRVFKKAGVLGGLQIPLLAQHPVRLGQGGDHHSVPAGEDLVVPVEGPPAAAKGRQSAALDLMLFPEIRIPLIGKQVGDALPFPDRQPVTDLPGLPRTQGLLYIGPGQEIELSLLAAAVRILAAGEAAPGRPSSSIT